MAATSTFTVERRFGKVDCVGELNLFDRVMVVDPGRAGTESS